MGIEHLEEGNCYINEGMKLMRKNYLLALDILNLMQF